MSRQELINLIGNVIYDVNSLMTELNRGQPDWNALEDISDDLTHYQKKLIKKTFETNTAKIRELTENLKQSNETIQETIRQVEQTVKTIDTLTKFVGEVESLLQVLGISLAWLRVE